MKLNAQQMHFQTLNQMVRECSDQDIVIDCCVGQRYIGSGMGQCRITVNGTPGNALGAYLNGGVLVVNGNAQDATGDTMNDGSIIIHGSSGDATGYAMRGGEIMINGNVGYRAGIHMKEYQDKRPMLIIGGTAGSFLGEYQAGGTIIVLGLHSSGSAPVNNFCGMGMHGGKIYLRTDVLPGDLSQRLMSREADDKDMEEILPALKRFCDEFGESLEKTLRHSFYVIVPNSSNPYRQLYAAE